MSSIEITTTMTIATSTRIKLRRTNRITAMTITRLKTFNHLIYILLIVASICYIEICSLFMSLVAECVIVNTNLPSRTSVNKPSKPPSTLEQYLRHNKDLHYKSRFNNQPQDLDGINTDYSNEQINDERRLFNYLMRNYDNTVRPVHNASKPINIRLGITLTQIFDLDEKNQVLTTNVWLDQEWIDEFLTWNSSEFGNITKIRIPCQSIWLPDIVLYNNADDYNRGYMNSRAIIEPNGNVFWPPPTKFRSTCQVDVTYFPFDDQTCIMKLGSWIYDGLSVNIENRTQNVDLSNYVSNGEWDLIRTSLVRNVVYYPCCFEPFPDVTITIVIRRKILYYMYNVIVPCIMMSLLTLLVFCLPPESGEKIALGVTVLLAFSVFMLAISEKLPETSESIPLLGVYLTVVMGIASVSIVMTVVVLNFHYCSPLNKHELPQWIKSWIVADQTTFDDYYTARSMSDGYCRPGFTTTISETVDMMNHPQQQQQQQQVRSCCPARNKMATTTSTTSKIGDSIENDNNKIYPNILSPMDLLFSTTPTTEQDSTTNSTLLSINNNNNGHQKLHSTMWKRKQEHYYLHNQIIPSQTQSQNPSDSSCYYLQQQYYQPHSAAVDQYRQQNQPNSLKHNHSSSLKLQDPEDIHYMYASLTPPISGITETFDKEIGLGCNLNPNNSQQLFNTIAPIVCASSSLIRRGQMATLPINNQQNKQTILKNRRRPIANHHNHQTMPSESNENVEPEASPPPFVNYIHKNSTSRCIDDQYETISGNNSNQKNFDREMIQIIRYLMYRQEVDDNIGRRIHEWRLFSMFIDKVLFWIFTITTIITSVVFLLIIPVKQRGF